MASRNDVELKELSDAEPEVKTPVGRAALELGPTTRRKVRTPDNFADAEEGLSVGSQTDDAMAEKAKRSYTRKAKATGITVQAPTPSDEVEKLRQAPAADIREKFLVQELRACRGSVTPHRPASPNGRVDDEGVYRRQNSRPEREDPWAQ